MDLRFEKEIGMGNGQLRFTIDVFNLFNSAYVLSVEDRFELPSFGAPKSFNEPRRMRLGVRYTF
jgi:outer membrane receptor protein involved in Fe transport